ncbi:hypothetical protein ABID97_003794 [Variovorax sp. OAS795]
MATAHAARTQRTGQPVGQGIELRVAADASAVAHRGAVGLKRHARQEAGMRDRRAPQRNGWRLQRDQCLRPFGRQHLEAADRFVRRAHARAQHALEDVEPALHGGLVEQARVVLRLDLQPAVERPQVQEHLGVLVLARDRVLRDLQPGERLGAAGHVGVHVEHHAHQRQAARVALQGKLAEQRAVGQRLVLEGVEHGGAAFAHEGIEAQLGRCRDAQGQQVHTVADQARHVARKLAGGRNADHDVVLSREAVQRGDEAAEQAREEAGPGLGARRAQVGDEAAVEQALGTPRVEGARGRTRMVQREFEHRQGTAGEALEPVVHVRLHVGMQRFGRFHGGEVGIRGGRLQLLSAAGLFRIQLAELFRDDHPGPAVADHVVGGHHQLMLGAPEPVQHGPEQRPVLQRERRAHGFGVRGLQGLLACFGREAAQVFLLQRAFAGLAHQHAGAVRRDGGPQRLVPGDQPRHGTRHGFPVQRPAQAQQHRLVVRQRGFGAQRRPEPDLALRLRRGNHAFDETAGGGRAKNGVHAAAFPLMS